METWKEIYDSSEKVKQLKKFYVVKTGIVANKDFFDIDIRLDPSKSNFKELPNIRYELECRGDESSDINIDKDSRGLTLWKRDDDMWKLIDKWKTKSLFNEAIKTLEDSLDKELNSYKVIYANTDERLHEMRGKLLSNKFGF